jgi:hypothetical protein
VLYAANSAVSLNVVLKALIKHAIYVANVTSVDVRRLIIAGSGKDSFWPLCNAKL